MATYLAPIAELLALLILTRCIWTAVYNVYFSPLRRFPGPLLWRLTEVPYHSSQIRGKIHRDVLKLHQKYGSVVRIGPNDLSYGDESAWKDVWAHRQGHAEFPKKLNPTPVNGVQGIIGAEREAHSRFRRLLSHAFSAQGLQEQEPRIKEYVDLLVQGLAVHGQERPVDMVGWFNWTTFDLIGDLAFGESFGCLKNARTHPWIAGVLGNVASLVFIQAIKAYNLTFLLLILVPKRLLKLRQENYQYSAKMIAERVQKGSARGDFFDKILQKPEGEGGMTIKELETNASTLVLAGSETTATLLSGTVFYLISNPLVLKKVVQELRRSFHSENEITVRSSSEQHYLLAVLNETARLYPPVPTMSSRCVPLPGDTIDGVYLPGGTVIHFHHAAAYRLGSNFARPDEFLPERWMGDPEFAGDNQAVFQPFSVGPRNCIGKNLAYAEMRLIMTRLLWRFDLSIPEGMPKWCRWAEDQKSFFLWDKSPLMVSVRDRL